MVVLDLDISSSPSPDAQLTFRWNGLWTGFRPTQLLSAYILNEKRGFGFSFDTDNKNRLYEITTSHTDDYGVNGTVPATILILRMLGLVLFIPPRNVRLTDSATIDGGKYDG